MKDKMVSIYEKCGCLVLILVILLCIALIFGIYCLEGWIFMLLWNWLAVGLLGAKALGYWVCVGICFALHFLKSLLFPSRNSK